CAPGHLATAESPAGAEAAAAGAEAAAAGVEVAATRRETTATTAAAHGQTPALRPVRHDVPERSGRHGADASPARPSRHHRCAVTFAPVARPPDHQWSAHRAHVGGAGVDGAAGGPLAIGNVRLRAQPGAALYGGPAASHLRRRCRRG